jgi:GcrA cell cycle regulator
MQSSNWAPEHCDALRQFFVQRMSYSEIANAINAKFGTAYSRNATIGRSRRMGLCRPRPSGLTRRIAQIDGGMADQKRGRRSNRSSATLIEPVKRAQSVTLRCVGIKPRLLPLADLKDCDCRYPYGGDKNGEAITFCGRPRIPGSSYCAPHFHLTRGPDVEPEPAARPVVLRLVAAA